jgi:hypothetical protein
MIGQPDGSVKVNPALLLLSKEVRKRLNPAGEGKVAEVKG